MQSTESNITSPEPVTRISETRLPKKYAAKKAANDPFGYSRDFLDNRFVYLTISPRASGLSIGINLNPDGKCNFDCLYCDVNRSAPRPDWIIDCEAAAQELGQTLTLVQGGGLGAFPPYRSLPPDLLRLRHVALSGDGEPTASPRFLEAVQTVVHIRARARFPFFKIVLITNASFLDLPQVQAGLSLFTGHDEIWAKLDAGTQQYMDLINRPTVSLEKVLDNILRTGRVRPVIIQSLFSSVEGLPPTLFEIEEFAKRIEGLKNAGAKIPLVQIYSATRPRASEKIRHLPLHTMAEIAAIVRKTAGVRAEVF